MAHVCRCGFELCVAIDSFHVDKDGWRVCWRDELLEAVSTDPLTDSELAAIARTDRNCRLIKGQVFLWEDARGWEDLWDLDGTITK